MIEGINKAIRILLMLVVIGQCTIVSAQSNNLNICLSPEHQANNLLLHVVVDDFTDILAYQFGVSWNNAQYELIGYENLCPELTQLTESNFGPQQKITDQASMIRTSWNDLSATSVSLDNGTVLFTMRFKKLSNSIGFDFNIAGHRWFRTEVVNKKMEIINVKSKVENCLEDTNEDTETTSQLSIDNQESNVDQPLSINITPNPTSNMALVEYNQKVSGELQILGMEGGLIEKRTFKGQSNYAINLVNYNPGPYILKFIAESGEVVTKRLIRIQ